MRKNKKKGVIALLLLVVIGMGVGYSILSKQLKIEGSVSIDAEYDVSIIGIEKLQYPDTFRNLRSYGLGLPKGTATENASPTFSTNTANFNVTLGLNSSIAYLVKIKNTGTVDAVIDNIDIANTGSGINVETNIVNIDDENAEGNCLNAGETLNYVLNISNDQKQELNSNLKSNITITLDTKQKLNADNYFSGLNYLTFSENIVEDNKVTGVKLNYLPVHSEINYISEKLYASVDGGEYEEVASFEGNIKETDIVYNLPENYDFSGMEHTVKLKMGNSGVFSTNEITLVY